MTDTGELTQGSEGNSDLSSPKEFNERHAGLFELFGEPDSQGRYRLRYLHDVDSQGHYRMYYLPDTDAVSIKAGSERGWVHPSANLREALSAKIAIGVKIGIGAEIGSCADIKSGAEIGSYAKIRSYAEIGSGAKIGSGAEIGSYAKVGSFVEVGPDAQIGSDSDIEPDAKIGASAKLGSNVGIGSHAKVGSYAEIGSGMEIGAYANIGSDAAIRGWKKQDTLCIYPIGSEDGILCAYRNKSGGLTVTRGCFQGTLDEFAAAVETTHAGSTYGLQYRAVIEMLKARYADLLSIKGGEA